MHSLSIIFFVCLTCVKYNQKQIMTCMNQTCLLFVLQEFLRILEEEKTEKYMQFYILPNPALPEILWWFIVNQGLVVVTVNWQQKLCTGVTKVSQTSLGVADDTFPGQKYKFLPKRSILFNHVNFWARNEVGRCYLTCALINMKLA